jgi:hypothetical protein
MCVGKAWPLVHDSYEADHRMMVSKVEVCYIPVVKNVMKRVLPEMLRWEDVTKRVQIEEAFKGLESNANGNKFLRYISIESARIVQSMLNERERRSFKKVWSPAAMARIIAVRKVLLIRRHMLVKTTK